MLFWNLLELVVPLQPPAVNFCKMSPGPFPELQGCGDGHVIHNFDSQVDGIGATEHRAEEDFFQHLAGIGFGTFDFCHSDKFEKGLRGYSENCAASC